jgi:leishmanolysin
MVPSVNSLRSRALARSALFLTIVTAVSRCGGGPSGPSEPSLLVFTSGENQYGQVGLVLAKKVVVEARNSAGPVADVSLVMSVESPGGGTVTPTTAKTAANGTAEFTWRLGGKLGVQTLTASTTGQTPLHTSTTANAAAGPASAVIAETNVLQSVVVGHPVTTLPSVKVTDTFGNPIGGVPVTFESLQAGSVLTGAQVTTDAAGTATLGGWTIGPDALVYAVRARIASGASAAFEARGIPATITAVQGSVQTANAGTAVSILPAVKAVRDDGSPLPNVPFTFSVAIGGGSVTGANAMTGADGIARPTMWVLGPVAGTNRMEAITFGHLALTFDATGVAASPASAAATGGTALNGIFGNYLVGAPEVTVTDALGNPVAGVSVGFEATQGGGQVTALGSQTDFLGRASASSWRLGPAGVQSVTATVTGLPPVVFTATGSPPPASTFRIEVRYSSSCSGCIAPTPAQQAAFDAAVARWTQLILAGGPPYLIKPSEIIADCGSVSGTIDGVVIVAQLHPIDGVNNVLGRAFPCIVRDQGFLPATGVMEFDTADLANLEGNGTLNHVILHEMAHVLGFGTMWNFNIPGTLGYDATLGTNQFLIGTTSGDPTFNGLGARAAFFGSLVPGTTFPGVPVSVEANFGAGTRLSHWRESSFANELMTGFLSSSLNPLSSITVQSFRDLGYAVDDAPADSYLFQGQVQGAAAAMQLLEGQPPAFIAVVNRQGRIVARLPRMPLK